MKKFKVEHNDLDKPICYITLFKPPYENENVLAHTGWKEKDVIITEIKQYLEEE